MVAALREDVRMVCESLLESEDNADALLLEESEPPAQPARAMALTKAMQATTDKIHLLSFFISCSLPLTYFLHEIEPLWFLRENNMPEKDCSQQKLFVYGTYVISV